MKIKKGTSILFLIIFSQLILAQTSIQLKNELIENAKFETMSDMKISMNMQIEGNEEAKKMLLSSMGKLPIISKNLTRIVTENYSKKGDILPFKINFYSLENSSSNSTTPIKNSLDNTVIFGHHNQTETKIDSFYNKDADSNLLQFKQILEENFTKRTIYPTKLMKVGDTFITNTPLNMPMGPNNVLKLNTKITYTLKSISSPYAYYEVDIRIEMTEEPKNFDVNTSSELKMRSSGFGTGKLDYNFLNHTEHTIGLNQTLYITFNHNAYTMIQTMKTDQLIRTKLIK